MSDEKREISLTLENLRLPPMRWDEKITNWIFRVCRHVKYWFVGKCQKMRYGFRYIEVWNLNTYVAKYILKRIDAFIDGHKGHPNNLTDEEYVVVLKKIRRAMWLTVNEEYSSVEEMEQQLVEIDEGCKLLGQYFMHLWD